MDLSLAGRCAWVTGASQGIGLAVAQRLAAEGARVVLSARNETALADAVEGIRDAGGEAMVAPADVTRPAELEAAHAQATARFGAPSIMIANAGGPASGTPSELSDEAWEAAMRLTFLSAVRLARLVLPEMRRAGWGRIVNVTSLSVPEPILGLALSNAMRSAVTSFARTLATEVAPDGVTVNNVAPGYTATDAVLKLFPTEQARADLVADIPVGRLAEPAEIAAATAFLVSNQASYITGQTLLVDGGLVKRLL